jgi:glutathione synthase/RimK-type ligase-like ATP-grasp enzyme
VGVVPAGGRDGSGPLQLALVTGGAEAMPVPDPESHLLLDALRERGVRAGLVRWDEPRDWAAVPLVLCRTPWDYFTRPDAFLAWVRGTGAATRLLNHPGLIAWNAHKRYLAELAERDVPVVPTTVLGPGSSPAARAAALAVPGDVVVKPAVSGGARGTVRVPADSDAAREHLAALLRAGDALVQPYLPQVEDGEVSLVLFAGELSHAVRKTPAPGDFRVQEEHGGSVAVHEPTDAERAVARGVLDALPWPTTYARIDLVTADDGPLLMEAELIEPELFLRAVPAAAGRLADVLVADLRAGPAR